MCRMRWPGEPSTSNDVDTNAYAVRAIAARSAHAAAHGPLTLAAPLALPTLPPLLAPATPTGQDSDTAIAVAAMDDHGRLRLPGLLAHLDWDTGTALTPRVLVEPSRAVRLDTTALDAPGAVTLIDKAGRLMLPLAARRALNLVTGSKLLLTVAGCSLLVLPSSFLAGVAGEFCG